MPRSLEDKTDRELLEELYVKVHQNNKMIKGVYSRMKFQNFLGVVKWIIYVGIAVGIYTYLQPFYQSILDTYSQLQDSANAIIEVKEKIPSIPFISN